MSRALVLPVLLVVSGGLACSNGNLATPRLPEDADVRWVLFIGNSHTYVNDLPGMLQSLARLSGTAEVRAEAVAFGGYALQDHWVQGDARRALEQKRWDFVVLQQGPSSLPQSREHLAHWTGKFAPLIRQAGAEPVLYQTWPSAAHRSDAANALVSYRAAAASVAALLAPAGDAFTAIIDEYPEIGPYAADGAHASMRGAYLAALTLLARINGSDPRRLAPRIPGTGTDSVIVRRLQHAAATALERNPARP